MMTHHITCNHRDPGHVFAAVGLMELANRLGGPVEASFETDAFKLTCPHTLTDLVKAIANPGLLTQLDPGDLNTPIQIGTPFNMRLDWWRRKEPSCKIWGGSMDVFIIAESLRITLQDIPEVTNMFNHRQGIQQAGDPSKKKEPFSFEGRRGGHMGTLDVGFSSNAAEMESQAAPAVEFLALVGLQRTHPTQLKHIGPDQHGYSTWTKPIPMALVPMAIAGILPGIGKTAWTFRIPKRVTNKNNNLRCFTPAQGA